MKRFTVVAIDMLGDWTYPELIERAGGAIYTLYAYDPDDITEHGCESSYWLVPFDCVPNLKPSDENEWENLYDELQFGFLDGCKAAFFDCDHIDGLDEKFKREEEFDNGCTLDDAAEEFRSRGTVPEVCR